VAIVNDKLQTLMFPAVSHPRLSWALLILRLFVRVAFIQHGSGKLIHPSEFAAEFGIPVWLALVTMLTQLIGGILLILGALTPLAALRIAGTMVTATIFLINPRRALHQSRRSQLGKLGFLSDSRHLPGSERGGSLVVGCLALRSSEPHCGTRINRAARTAFNRQG
jgi:uncharacterized membrane protein YphA (DoxX/SURF4 family)